MLWTLVLYIFGAHFQCIRAYCRSLLRSGLKVQSNLIKL